MSQFNSVGGGAVISDSSLNQDQTEDQVQEQRKRKILIQKCIEKFNYKSKVGLKFAFDEKIVDKPLDINKKPSESESDEEALALWQRSVYQFAELLYSQRGSLDRVTVGLYFGDESKYNQDIFQQFLSYFNMANQNIVQGLRILFKIIYPPGNSEAVDRILQQFGEKYISDNPNYIYKNASVAYTLSYAIMMLQTNLYNVQVKEKEKMSIASFSKLISTINDGEDLPQDHVESLYNSVKEEPLGIHDQEDYQNKLKEAINSDAVLKTKKFKEEQERMLAQGKQSFSNENEIESQKFIRVLTPNFTKELLDVIWSPLFATFSQGLEQSEDKKFILTCLEGFKYCIMLLGRYSLLFQQETFVQCLTKNTGLLQDKPFSTKNILSNICMIEIASTSGNWLRGSWKYILDCLSRIDYFLSGDFVNKEIINHQINTLQMLENDKSNQKFLQMTLESELIDKIFNSTSKFECEALQDFIDCLCQTCKQEISISKPRTFSLQRISEVAEFNMDRVRFEWNKIWTTLSNLFQVVGTKGNSYCAQLVIDLLKQLSMKFLKKSELSHYSFQKTFLQPFQYIFENTDDSKYEIFELILSCLKMITSINYDNLRSGWSVIINLVSQTINKKIDSLIVICSQIIDQIFLKDRSLENLFEVIPEIGDILCKLIQLQDQQISSNCIGYLNKLIDYLVIHSKFISNHTFSQSQILEKNDIKIQIEIKQQRAQEYEKMLTCNQLQLIFQYSIHILQTEMWLPSLTCLSKMYGDRRLPIQRQIESYSNLFTEDFWKVLFTELFIPYFENMSVYLSEKLNQDQYIVLHMKDSCQISFDSLIEIFSSNFLNMQSCLKYMLFILENSITRFQDVISKIAAEQMQSLLVNIGQYLSIEQLNEVLSFLELIFDASLPKQFVEAYSSNEYLRLTYEDVIVHKKINDLSRILVNLDLNYKRILSQVVIQLICINCSKEYFMKYQNKFKLEVNFFQSRFLIYLPFITSKQLERLKRQLFSSYQFATEFNKWQIYYIKNEYFYEQNFGLINGSGFLSDATFPQLLIQQRDSRSVLLLIWFENYIRECEENRLTGSSNKTYLKLFLDNAITSITKFVEYSRSVSDSQENQSKIQFDLYYKKSADDSFQSFEKIIRNQYLFEKNKYIIYLRNNISQIILPNLKSIQPTEYYDRITQLLAALVELSSYSFQRNLLSITCTSCQKCDMCKSQSVDSFDIDLKIIIKNIFSFMMQFMPQTLPSQFQEPPIQKQQEVQKQQQQESFRLQESVRLSESVRLQESKNINEEKAQIRKESYNIQTPIQIVKTISSQQSNQTINQDDEKVNNQQIILEEQQNTIDIQQSQDKNQTQEEEGEQIMNDQQNKLKEEDDQQKQDQEQNQTEQITDQQKQEENTINQQNENQEEAIKQQKKDSKQLESSSEEQIQLDDDEDENQKNNDKRKEKKKDSFEEQENVEDEQQQKNKDAQQIIQLDEENN